MSSDQSGLTLKLFIRNTAVLDDSDERVDEIQKQTEEMVRRLEELESDNVIDEYEMGYTPWIHASAFL